MRFLRRLISNKIFNIRPLDKNDYYTIGRFMVSRNLISAVIYIIGILGLYYFLALNPSGIFNGSENSVRTYSYKSPLLKFASGRVNIKAKSGYTAYIGNVSKGKANGQGTLYKKSGDIRYKGNFKDSEYNGNGTLYMDSGIYQGEFKNNKFEGNGELLRTDGSTEYKGGFSDGKKSGEGELYDNAGQQVYKGNFNEDILLYTDFIGKSSLDAAQMYTGRRTIYYDDKNFAVDMEDINALYAGSSDEDYLDDSVQIHQVFVKSDKCMFAGKITDTISGIREIAGEPSFEGYSYITMPEAVALSEGLELSGDFEDVREVTGYNRDDKLYLTMFEYSGLQYTFYGYEAGEKFVMYEVEE